jgi:hypothetical protein
MKPELLIVPCDSIDGYLPRAIHASCTFPGLFQPVMIDGAPHIDGACFDQAGILGLPGLPPSKVCVNVVCSRLQSFWSVLPAAHKDGKVRNAFDRVITCKLNPMMITTTT